MRIESVLCTIIPCRTVRVSFVLPCVVLWYSPAVWTGHCSAVETNLVLGDTLSVCGKQLQRLQESIFADSKGDDVDEDTGVGVVRIGSFEAGIPESFTTVPRSPVALLTSRSAFGIHIEQLPLQQAVLMLAVNARTMGSLVQQTMQPDSYLHDTCNTAAYAVLSNAQHGGPLYAATAMGVQTRTTRYSTSLDRRLLYNDWVALGAVVAVLLLLCGGLLPITRQLQHDRFSGLLLFMRLRKNLTQKLYRAAVQELSNCKSQVRSTGRPRAESDTPLGRGPIDSGLSWPQRIKYASRIITCVRSVAR